MTLRDLTADASLMSLNIATVREKWNLEQCIDGCARHGIAGLSVWRDKLAECGLDKAVRMIRDAGLKVSGLCRGGMFPVADPSGRTAMLEDNFRAIDEAAALEAAAVILVVGGLPEGSKDIAGARRQVEDGIASILDHARSAGVPLAIEPLHPMYAADRACVNTLGQANDLCARLGPGVGVAIDAYHVWWDPDLEREIARAGEMGIVLAHHVCDWLVPTTDLLLDRGMMGDGVIDLPQMRGWIEAAGYDGLIEVEIFSVNNWWKRDPDEVLATCVERFRTVV